MSKGPRAPRAHAWVKEARRLWRCPWCGACVLSDKKPSDEAANSPFAQTVYARKGISKDPA